MPIYTVEHKKTKNQKEVNMPWAEKEQWLKDNPNYIFIIGAPKIISQTSVQKGKLPEGFKDKMREAKKLHPLSKGLDHII
tara:strand:- start:1063 stop:1302 length:240 start_codon:yes stop_codon:yes gene_type:complete